MILRHGDAYCKGTMNSLSVLKNVQEHVYDVDIAKDSIREGDTPPTPANVRQVTVHLTLSANRLSRLALNKAHKNSSL